MNTVKTLSSMPSVHSLSTRVNAIPYYVYKDLHINSQEIRLVTLLPGSFDDPIRIFISHQPLIIPPEQLDKRLTLEELRKTLPSGWKAFESTEGRYFFENQVTDDTTLIHPDPDFNAALYEDYANDRDPSFTPQYEALSYTWGSSNELDTTLVVSPDSPGSSIIGSIDITKNLASALRHLRQPTGPRNLWIDALCINQRSNPERNAQVKRMRYIYALAYRVVIWLGPADDSSGLALSTLEYLGKQLLYTTIRSRCRAPNAEQPMWYRALHTHLPYDEATWHSLSKLLHRPWFDRLWVIQEVQLGNRHSIIQCGSDVISWILFCRGVRSLISKELPIEHITRSLEGKTILTMQMTNFTFPVLMAEVKQKKCSDPRDNIYGILSLVSPDLASGIQVEYSLPYEDVCKARQWHI
jgi:hypothetical protein